MAVQLVRIQYGSGPTTINIATPVKEENFFTTRAKRKITSSVNGQHQVSWDHNEETKVLKFTFLTETERDALETMYQDWASLGNSITYIPDRVNAPSTSYTVIVINDTFQAKRVAIGVDFFDIDLTVRKVIT